MEKGEPVWLQATFILAYLRYGVVIDTEPNVAETLRYGDTRYVGRPL